MKTAILAAVSAALFLGPASARELVPWTGQEDPGSIVIETSERRLYYVIGAGEAIGYDIAVGKPGRTWFGTTEIISKAKHPTWRPTDRMRRENPMLPVSVSPGPKNPLGIRALYLAQGALRIHGTNAPGSIGSAASSGCFRMHNEDVAHLYEIVDVGAVVYVDR